MKQWLRRAWRENATFVVFIGLMFIFRSAVADWNVVPTGSMKPTILEGDRILVDKMAYDLRLPFTHLSLYHRDDPQRGDIVVFDSAVSGKRLVKRVVGIPGDLIAMHGNTLMINGQELAYLGGQGSGANVDLIEDLLGVEHMVRIDPLRHNPAESFPPLWVPADNYFVLGDNRDNSADSRYIGFVPREEIVGRAGSVILSLDYDNYYLPRPDRFFTPLAL